MDEKKFDCDMKCNIHIIITNYQKQCLGAVDLPLAFAVHSRETAKFWLIIILEGDGAQDFKLTMKL